MKDIYSISALAIALITAACSGRTSSDAGFDTPVYTPQYATGFDITSADGMQSSLISVTNPWQGADSVVSSLLIVRNGETAPDGFTGQILNGNASRIVAMSSTHTAMLHALQADSLVVGVSGLNFISNPFIRANRDRIGDVGYDGNINYELLLSLNPDIVLIYGVNGASAMESKLAELNIPYMYVGDYLEESPLGKAEWLVAIAELTGLRTEGEKEFGRISRAYGELRQLVDSAATTAPTVMLNTPYGDTWFLPSTSSYMSRLIADAGGEYIYKSNTGNSSQPIDMEEAYRLTSEADIWLNTGAANTLDELRTACPKFTDTGCFRNGQVYNNTLRTNAAGGNDFYESSAVRPDVLLRDLVRIFHPELITGDLYYYKQLK